MNTAKLPAAAELQRLPTIRAEDGFVILRLPLRSRHDAADVQEIDVFLTPVIAVQTAESLRELAQKI